MAIAVGIPPAAEQSAIASFLDRETVKIDALVDEQKRLIELLKEKRQAVISHAVTKGLDPNAPMKDSGVEWLGQVPEHWDVKPLKHLVRFKSGGTPAKDNLAFWDGSIPWASAKDLKAETIYDTVDHITEAAIASSATDLVPEKSVLVLVRGMTLAHSFPVVLAGRPMAINQDLKALTSQADVQSEFLAWLLRGAARESLSRVDEAGHGTKALRMDAWTSLRLSVPPSTEQLAIASFLSQETAKIDALIERAREAISLLGERRSALISAAVTGKIDVRGVTTEIAEAAA